LSQVELLLTQLLPRSTLAELTALEAIFKALAAKDAAAAATSAGGSGMLLDVPALLHQVLAQTCRCYTQLKEGGAAAEAADGGCPAVDVACWQGLAVAASVQESKRGLARSGT
jgi:hypothetical protein